MTIETHEKAKSLRIRIHRIDDILELLNGILSSGSHNLEASICEAGFIAHPKHVLIDRDEIAVIVSAFEAEREKLEREFAQL